MNRTAISDPTWTGPTRHPLGVGDVYRSGDLLAIASIEPTGAHISVSAPGRYPTWDEYVNLHQTCLHIWEATP